MVTTIEQKIQEVQALNHRYASFFKVENFAKTHRYASFFKVENFAKTMTRLDFLEGYWGFVEQLWTDSREMMDTLDEAIK